MPTIWLDGKSYYISDEANEALCDFGPDVASGQMTEEEAVKTVLRADGYDVE